MKKNKNLLILIVTSIIMFLAILIYKKITPFGDNSFLDIDFFHQYFPMSGEMHDRIWHFKSLIYSFNYGIGIPIFRNYFNYLSSPFNILILLFKRTSMLSVYTFIICLKGILSSVCMFLLLKKKLGDKFILVPISLMYAFSAYYLAFHWNIMWMDGMSFLPLVILGLEKMVDKNKSLLYILSLSLVIYCNYYIGFMICMFVVLYFVMYLFTSKKYSKKDLLKKICIFVISSLLVGLLCSFFLIPMYYSIKSISAVETFKLPDSLYYHFKAREFLFNHFSFITSTVIHSDVSNTPNVSCGILSLLLIIPFIFNKKINLKVKIGYLSLLIFLGVSFFVPALDYLWHICHVPNDLPYRFSFLYSFILIIISAYSIVNIKHVNKWYVFSSFILVFASIVYLYIVKYDYIANVYIISNIIVVLLYLVYYLIYILSDKKKIPIILTFITIIINILMTVNINWNMDAKVSGYYYDYNSKRELISEIEEKDNSFYRIGKEDIFTYNDAVWYGFRGINSFSSMEYESVASLMHKIGYPGNVINSYYYKKGNKIGEILFDIKYGIYQNGEDIDYYKTPYNSSLMFMVDKNIYDWDLNNNPFEVENDFVKKAYGIENVYKKLEPIDKIVLSDDENERIVKYIYKSDSFNYYVYSSNTNLNTMAIGNEMYAINNYTIQTDMFDLTKYLFKVYDEMHIIEGYKKEKEFEIITISSYDEVEPFVYEIDDNKIQLFDSYVVNNSVEINNFNEHSISASIDATEDGVIYTSIPYDIGWKVYVDGKKVETKKIGDALLSFSVEKGEHNIELEYHIPYLVLGIVLSLISVILIIYFERKRIL